MNEITEDQVQSWEDNTTLPPSIERLADVLEVPPEWLLFGSEGLHAFSCTERQIMREHFRLIESVYRKGFESGQKAVRGKGGGS